MAQAVSTLNVEIMASAARFKNNMAIAGQELNKFSAKAKRMATGVNRSFNNMSKAVFSLQGAMVALGAVGAGGLVKVADDVNQLKGKIKNAIPDVREFNTTFDALVSSANRSGVSLDSTAQGFVRLVQAARPLGYTNEQIIQFNETFSKMGALAGATADEVGGAMIQISQGIASGRLQGDELRTVLESMPAVGRAIAESMGIGFGELRQAAKEGKVTAVEVLNAIIGKTKEVEEQFSLLPPSVARSTQSMKNNLTLLIGTINDTFKITDTLAGGVEWLSVKIQEATSFIQSHQQTVANWANIAANTANKAYNAVMIVVNSIRSLVSGTLSAVINLFEATANAFTLPFGKKLNFGGTAALEVFKSNLDSLNGSIAAFNTNIKPFKAAVSSPSFGAVSGGGGGGGDSKSKSKKTKKAKKPKAFDPDAIRGLGQSFSRTFADDATAFFKAITDGVSEFEDAITTDFTTAADKFKQKQQEIASIMESVQTPIENYNQKIQEATQYLQDGWIGQETYNRLAREAKDNLFPDLVTKADQYSMALTRINDALSNGIIGEEQAAQLRENAKVQFTDYGQQLQAIENSVRNYGRAFEDAFVNSIKNGEANFKQFATSILEDIGRMILRMTILNQLFGGTTITGKQTSGLISKAIVSIGSSLTGKATGGTMSGNRSYLVGERGPEIFTPGKTGTMTPNNRMGDMGGGQPMIVQQFQITGDVDAKVNAQIQRLMPQIERRTRAALIAEIQSGGRFSRVVGRTS